MAANTMTDELTELRHLVRGFLDRHSTESEVRRLMATTEGYDTGQWHTMGGELGLQGLAIPEKHGGSGFGYAELGVVFEEMGRALLCAPYFATIALAAEALLRSSHQEFLPDIAAGHAIATLALNDAEPTTARRDGDHWLLTGAKTYVLDACIADLILVTADHALFVIDTRTETPGLTRQCLPTIDQTRKQGHLAFDNVPARLVTEEADPVIERTLTTAAVLLAAEQLGGAERMLAVATEYAKVREQYGRLIGSFQGVKHRLADMLTDVECARSAVTDAVRALTQDAEDLPVAAALAKAFCSEVYTRVAGGAIQVHGGIGFSWEHPAHLYFKRAKSSELLLGTPAQHRARLARELGL